MGSIQLKKIVRGKLWRFFGGIHPKEMKTTSHSQIEELKLPSLICLPLDKHLGQDGEILVSVGDYVLKGQQLTKTKGRLVPVHASTSGTVIAIENKILPHPSGFKGLTLTIKPDGKDLSIEPSPIKDWENTDINTLLEKIHLSGVEGMGGAQFQTDAKLKSALDEAVDGTNVLIINGAECEPAITCDDRLMQEKAEEIALGIKIVNKILQPKVTLVAIEDNKKEAIKAMQKACEGIAQIRVIKTLYPSGAARNLIKILTGIEVPYNAHTSECGIVVNNVSTIFAIKEAIVDGLPVTSRVVTMTGKCLKRTGNANVRLGTSLRFLLSSFGLKPEFQQRIILGGPMMGFTVPSIDIPITKSSNCVLAPSISEIPKLKEAQNCIRCGRCARVCPSRLVPYQMYKQSMAHNHAAAQKCGIKDCTLCGSCAYVCPSQIPLTAQFRYEKAVESHLAEAKRRNAHVKERMDAHNERVAQEQALREKKKQEALARIKAQKEAEAKMSPEELKAMREKQLAEAKAKAAARKKELLASKAAQNEKPSDAVAKPVVKEQAKASIQEIKNTDTRRVPSRLKQDAQTIDSLNTKQTEVKPYVPDLSLVGLEPNDKLQNPPKKKVVPQVLQSHKLEHEVVERKLPNALKKKD